MDNEMSNYLGLAELALTKKPYKIYANLQTLDPVALDQFVTAMQLDCVVKGALMPDAHAGYSLPIGAVVATVGKVFPAFVGYDIGCGMCAVPTTFNPAEIRANAKAIFDQIYRDVPTGFNHNAKPSQWSYNGPVSDFVQNEIMAPGHPGKQIGTLGGGNHFIEIGEDDRGSVWIILHSGSRGVGHKIATHYMRLASGDGKAREGCYGLDVDSAEGQNYINDLAFGLQFALDNRRLMIVRIQEAIWQALGKKLGHCMMECLINRNHNHAELRNETDGKGYTTGRKVWIHRKGATHAEEGMHGVIPGNMRDGSFIVRGKGNPDSLFSSSHGAGRVLSRKAANATLNLDEFTGTMRAAGVTAKVDKTTLDESPDAYKSIFEVMDAQKDLVEVIHHVKPIINIKGA